MQQINTDHVNCQCVFSVSERTRRPIHRPNNIRQFLFGGRCKSLRGNSLNVPALNLFECKEIGLCRAKGSFINAMRNGNYFDCSDFYQPEITCIQLENTFFRFWLVIFYRTFKMNGEIVRSVFQTNLRIWLSCLQSYCSILFDFFKILFQKLKGIFIYLDKNRYVSVFCAESNVHGFNHTANRNLYPFER